MALSPDAWVVIVGDSRSDPSGDVGAGSTGTWPYYLKTNCPFVAAPAAAGNWYNLAHDSFDTTNILGQFTAGDFEVNSNNPVLFFCWAAINDLLGGRSIADTYANLKSIWAQARAKYYKVIAFRTGVAAGMDETLAPALDKLIMSDPTLYDLLVHVDGIAPVAPWNDANHHFYLDSVHPNAALNLRIATAIGAMLGS